MNGVPHTLRPSWYCPAGAFWQYFLHFDSHCTPVPSPEYVGNAVPLGLSLRQRPRSSRHETGRRGGPVWAARGPAACYACQCRLGPRPVRSLRDLRVWAVPMAPLLRAPRRCGGYITVAPAAGSRRKVPQLQSCATASPANLPITPCISSTRPRRGVAGVALVSPYLAFSFHPASTHSASAPISLPSVGPRVSFSLVHAYVSARLLAVGPRVLAVPTADYLSSLLVGLLHARNHEVRHLLVHGARGRRLSNGPDLPTQADAVPPHAPRGASIW